MPPKLSDPSTLRQSLHLRARSLSFVRCSTLEAPYKSLGRENHSNFIRSGVFLEVISSHQAPGRNLSMQVLLSWSKRLWLIWWWREVWSQRWLYRQPLRSIPWGSLYSRRLRIVLHQQWRSWVDSEYWGWRAIWITVMGPEHFGVGWSHWRCFVDYHHWGSKRAPLSHTWCWLDSDSGSSRAWRVCYSSTHSGVWIRWNSWTIHRSYIWL